MRIIFSRDRPAQLDLLLRSLARYMPAERTEIIWRASTPTFRRGYSILGITEGEEIDFEASLHHWLAEADEFVTFFCDDDIVYREVPFRPCDLLEDNQVLTVCLYLGRGNMKQKIPPGFPIWEWGPLARHDFGYPCGVDGVTYRKDDLLRLIEMGSLANPNQMESTMMENSRLLVEERPLMACFLDQYVVSVPVNRVSPVSGVPFGRTWPQPAEILNEQFLAGGRIDLDALDFSSVNSCHHEIELVWE